MSQASDMHKHYTGAHAPNLRRARPVPLVGQRPRWCREDVSWDLRARAAKHVGRPPSKPTALIAGQLRSDGDARGRIWWTNVSRPPERSTTKSENVCWVGRWCQSALRPETRRSLLPPFPTPGVRTPRLPVMVTNACPPLASSTPRIFGGSPQPTPGTPCRCPRGQHGTQCAEEHC